jgi:tetratricopeptide (TPR) repeat protein
MRSTPAATLAKARENHAAGRLPEAISAYLELVATQPDLADAWHLLGVATGQLGRPDEAAASICRAIDIDPCRAEFHSDLGLVCRALKDHAGAIECYRRALALDPRFAQAHHNLGNALKDTGDLPGALAAYRRAIEIQPGYASARQSLANTLLDQGLYEEAAENYLRVLELRPDHAPAHAGLGHARKEQGHFDEAAAAYRRALDLRPGDPALHNNLGTALQAGGSFTEAAQWYRRALEIAPGHAPAHNNLGATLRSMGHTEEALPHFRRALEIDPAMAEACHNMGNALRDLNRRDDAAAYFRQMVVAAPGSADTFIAAGAGLAALKLESEAADLYLKALDLQPGSAVALFGLGNALRETGDLAGAAGRYRQALAAQPAYPVALVHLGLVLAELGDIDEGGRLCLAAMEMSPGDPAVYYGKGNIFKRRDQLPEAIASYRTALAMKPDFVEAWINLGYVLVEKAILEATGGSADFSDAYACYHRALESNPDNPEVRFMIALVRLLEGDYERGWAEYDWRWKLTGAEPRVFRQPPWRGEPFPGKTILLHAEQGYGDTIQFVRFAAVVKALGGRVVVLCPRELVPLLSRTPGVDHCCSTNDPAPAFDLQAPLMSVPRILGITLESIPASVPYLVVADTVREHWQAVIQPHCGFKVGIVWQGNPKQKRDRYRRIALKHFEPLAAIPGVRLFSLQKGAGAEQLAHAQFPIIDLGPQLCDFTDTAAASLNLDLIIGSCTSVVHLAAALGRPTWVCLGCVPDWRWLIARSDSPWYPTVRLFRQTASTGWRPVFAQLAAALRPLAQARGNRPVGVTTTF